MKMKSWYASGLIGAALLLTLTACGGTAQKTVLPSTTVAASPQGAAAQEPVTLENMGEKLVFNAPPKRAVTLNQHATEVMLALGLESSMAGTAYLDDRILPQYQKQYERIPVLSAKYPSTEVLLAANPDFAYAGWKSAFTEKTLGLRSDLAKKGIQTYVQQSSNKPGPSLEDVYEDILNIGRIFRVEPKAQQLVDDMKKQLAQIQSSIGPVDKPLKVFVYDSGEETAFTAANTYLTTLINKVGGKNIFDDIEKSWATVSWEEVISRNPDVIVVVDYGSTTVEQKKSLLLSKAPLADVAAVRNQRIVVLPLSAAAEGIRAPLALKTLAAGFYPDKVK